MDKDFRPVIFESQEGVPPGARVIDAWESAVRELFIIRNPALKGKPDAFTGEVFQSFRSSFLLREAWIFYPRESLVVRILPESEYFEIRTARNRDLITEKEQVVYRNFPVGIAGLSVGSSALQALLMSGGAGVVKIADYDVLEISNLNRIRGGLKDLGRDKVEIAADFVWSLDPYAKLFLYPEGLSSQNLDKFLLGDARLGVVVDAIDKIDMKILLRKRARDLRMPILMATDNGDDVILDVERFDLEPARPIFHGAIDDVDTSSLSELDFRSWLRLATRIVDPRILTQSMQGSLLKIGSSIAAVPQLGPTASFAGTSIAYAIRRIALGLPLDSGRYKLSLEEKLIPGFLSPESVREREQFTKTFEEKFFSPEK